MPGQEIGNMIAGGAGISHNKQFQGKELPVGLTSTPVGPGWMLKSCRLNFGYGIPVDADASGFRHILGRHDNILEFPCHIFFIPGKVHESVA